MGFGRPQNCAVSQTLKTVGYWRYNSAWNERNAAMSKSKSKYAPPSKTEVLEAIVAIPEENLRRRARETFLQRTGWNRTSASKNGNKKRWLSPFDRVLAHKLYMSGGAGKIVTDRIGERILHCKWRNGMNFWNARNDGKRLLAAKKRLQKTLQANTPKAQVAPKAEAPKAEVVETVAS
jgi:hypothetical protein